MSEGTVATLDRFSREEQQLRVDVAAAFRLLHRRGMSDHAQSRNDGSSRSSDRNNPGHSAEPSYLALGFPK